MLMLVAMSYNPMLFLALVIGYAIGDYIFFGLQLKLSAASATTVTDCH